MGKSGGASRAKAPVKASPKPAAPKRSAGLRAALDTIERKIVRNKVEFGHLVDPAGNTIMSKRGQRRQVMLSYDDLMRFRGNVFTHNHPIEASFSPADVRIAINYGLAEERAVTQNWRYSLRPPEGGWNGRQWDHIAIHYTVNLRQVKDELTAEVRAGRMSADAASAEILHRVWQRVAATTGMKYEREPWTSGVTPGKIPARKPRNRTTRG